MKTRSITWLNPSPTWMTNPWTPAMMSAQESTLIFCLDFLATQTSSNRRYSSKGLKNVWQTTWLGSSAEEYLAPPLYNVTSQRNGKWVCDCANCYVNAYAVMIVTFFISKCRIHPGWMKPCRYAIINNFTIYRNIFVKLCWARKCQAVYPLSSNISVMSCLFGKWVLLLGFRLFLYQYNQTSPPNL